MTSLLALSEACDPARAYTIWADRSSGTKLGIDVDTSLDGLALIVMSIKPGGLVDQWNGYHPDAKVSVADHIVEVGGVRGDAKQLEVALKQQSGFGITLFPKSAKEFAVETPLVSQSMEMESHSTRGTNKDLQSQSVGLPDWAWLPDLAWMHVIWHIYTHEVLNRVAVLSRSHVVLLGDERSWQTLALPTGAPRLAHLLQLLLFDEQELWAWPLCQVRFLELDLHGCPWGVVDKLQKLLFKGLDLNTLCTIKLHRVPIVPWQDPESVEFSKFDQQLIRLVNPVLPKFPAAARLNFLLVPAELGHLRLRLADFGFFRMSPSKADPGTRPATFDLVAKRNAEFDSFVLTQRSAWSGSEDFELAASAFLEREVGGLRSLHKSNVLVTDDFSGWASRLLQTYKQLHKN